MDPSLCISGQQVQLGTPGASIVGMIMSPPTLRDGPELAAAVQGHIANKTRFPPSTL
jgi:hypothetical protein